MRESKISTFKELTNIKKYSVSIISFGFYNKSKAF